MDIALSANRNLLIAVDCYAVLSANRNLLIAVDCYAAGPKFATFCQAICLPSRGTFCPTYVLQMTDHLAFNDTFSCSEMLINFKNTRIQMWRYNHFKITHHSLMENILQPHNTIKIQSPFSY